MKTFCESLRKHEMEIINFNQKKKKILTNEQCESSENTKIGYICEEKFKNKYAKDRKIVKLEIIAIIQVHIEMPHITYVI